jgi:hypothetical protein
MKLKSREGREMAFFLKRKQMLLLILIGKSVVVYRNVFTN